MDKLERLETDPVMKVQNIVPEEYHSEWKKTWGDSFSEENFFDHDELEWLTDLMYKQHHARRVKKNGTLHYFVNNELIKEKFYDKIKAAVPELDDTEWHGNFLITATPYNLHIDTADEKVYNGTVPGKQIIIPLFTCWTGNKDKDEDWYPECGTAVFKNRFLMYGTNFAKSDNEYDTNVFYTQRQYQDLVCYDKQGERMDVDWNKEFPDDLYKKHFDHFKKRWLDGFEFEAVHNWKRGNLIVFDRCQAHSGVNFQKCGVTLKAGLSLMTTTRNNNV